MFELRQRLRRQPTAENSTDQRTELYEDFRELGRKRQVFASHDQSTVIVKLVDFGRTSLTSERRHTMPASAMPLSNPSNKVHALHSSLDDI